MGDQVHLGVAHNHFEAGGQRRRATVSTFRKKGWEKRPNPVAKAVQGVKGSRIESKKFYSRPQKNPRAYDSAREGHSPHVTPVELGTLYPITCYVPISRKDFVARFGKN